jgi:hypothetical protein
MYLDRMAFPAAHPSVNNVLRARLPSHVPFDCRDWKLSLLWNPRAASAFGLHRKHEADALANNPRIWNTTTRTSDRLTALKRLSDFFVDAPRNGLSGRFPEPRIVFAWRSVAAPSEAYELARDGPRPMSKLDNGYFAKGIYFALEPALAATYLPDSPDACLVLFAISIAQPYPVTLEDDYTMEGQGFCSLRGGAIKPGHDAHFTPVRDYGHHHPLNPFIILPHPVHFQAAGGGAFGPEGHELCVEHHSQVTAVALLRPVV